MTSKKDFPKSIESLCSTKTIKVYNNWMGWLSDQKGYSKNTICSYSYDFKYFLNFLSSHISSNNIEIVDFKDLKIRDFRSWLSYLKNNNPNLKARSLARSRASIKSFYFYCIL
ncbi:MAG: hypothetical protein CMP36_00855, partial [Rickettsiales bacterium]